MQKAAAGSARGAGELGTDEVLTGGRGHRRGAVLTEAERQAERARAARAAEAAEAAKKARAEQRKLDRWRKAGYSSLAIPLASQAEVSQQSVANDSDTDEDDDDSGGLDIDGRAVGAHAGASGRARAASGGLRFVVGDAMTPELDAPASAAGNGSSSSASVCAGHVVLVWVDGSGRWPSRGFFRAVSAVTSAPQAAYESAHANSDLALGDAHLVDRSASVQGLHVALLVVLQRDKRAPYGTPPTLCTSSLDMALGRLGAVAALRGLSVHSPRLTTGSWYTVERLLRKHLSCVCTTVYYHKR